MLNFNFHLFIYFFLVEDLLSSKDITIAYIGLQSLPYNVSQRYWCDGTTLDYTYWMPEKPDNGDLKDDGCVVMNVNDGQWDDWTCDANKEIGPWATVCQIKYHDGDRFKGNRDDGREKNREKAKCPAGFDYFPSTKNCYKVENFFNL